MRASERRQAADELVTILLDRAAVVRSHGDRLDHARVLLTDG